MGRRLVVEADGGSRGNPGVAGSGAVVRDADTGAVLCERAEPLGTASNNVAEYTALVIGLTAAHRLDPAARIVVSMDSKLVVEQMSGRWKIKHEDMRRLAGQARRLVSAITAAGGTVDLTWVPRTQNQAADRLSNLAMDGQRIDRGPATEPEPSESAGPATTAAATLVLVRHAATADTRASLLDGRDGRDAPLDADGHLEAAAVAAELARLLRSEHVVRVVSSALRRATQTAAPIAAGLSVPVVVDARWDERAFGDLGGQPAAVLYEQRADDMRRLHSDAGYAPPGGESGAQFASRVRDALGSALDTPGATVVVTSRTPILEVLAAMLRIDPDRYWSWHVEPGSTTILDSWPDGEVSVRYVNRVPPAP